MVGDMRIQWTLPVALLTVVLGPLFPALANGEPEAQPSAFVTSSQCIACHSNLYDEDGNDVSIGHNWRSSMMAHSAKDPYWQAGVRREIIDHPELQSAIEDTCSTCHMPMARTMAAAQGEPGTVFGHLNGDTDQADSALALDGVSCTTCHQIRVDNLGTHESFDGGYRIDVDGQGERHLYGPYEVGDGHARIMSSASGYSPHPAAHIQSSELCATCHTLFTTARDDQGRALEPFPEQVPYLEWRHSGYRQTHSCQDCHMPEVDQAPISSVLGEPREAVSRHAFRGGNAFMLELLDRYRDELGVDTPTSELQQAVAETLDHLQNATAGVAIEAATAEGPELHFDVVVSNLAGHKLPSAYPSRRAWLHVTIIDANGAPVFESGAMRGDGSIVGNDNDSDPARFEPHYDEVTLPDQVQIFEPIIGDFRGNVTTGLLQGATYLKDNRLLPKGFDKATADGDIAVQGKAVSDDDFAAGGDRVRYRVAVDPGTESFEIRVRLRYQTIGYRWAHNLKAYPAAETDRFVGYYVANADRSAVDLADARSSVARTRLR
jgi:hypothetical protein